jgi:hypothetical protein
VAHRRRRRRSGRFVPALRCWRLGGLIVAGPFGSSRRGWGPEVVGIAGCADHRRSGRFGRQLVALRHICVVGSGVAHRVAGPLLGAPAGERRSGGIRRCLRCRSRIHVRRVGR